MAYTYYIRSWDPDSTYPENPQEGDLCYTITLNQEWAPVGGVKDNNIIKKEVYTNGSWSEEGSGGGASGITLCTGTFINNSQTIYDVFLCHADDTQQGTVGNFQMLPNVPRTMTVILYQGTAYGTVMYGPEQGEVAGDAEYSDGDLLVTGDFTLTFS